MNLVKEIAKIALATAIFSAGIYFVSAQSGSWNPPVSPPAVNRDVIPGNLNLSGGAVVENQLNLKGELGFGGAEYTMIPWNQNEDYYVEGSVLELSWHWVEAGYCEGLNNYCIPEATDTCNGDPALGYICLPEEARQCRDQVSYSHSYTGSDLTTIRYRDLTCKRAGVMVYSSNFIDARNK